MSTKDQCWSVVYSVENWRLGHKKTDMVTQQTNRRLLQREEVHVITHLSSRLQVKVLGNYFGSKNTLRFQTRCYVDRWRYIVRG